MSQSIFEIGKTYSCNSICDSSAKFTYTVVKRTEKTITFRNDCGETNRKKVSVIDGVEIIYPEGKYSMAPTLRASGLVVVEPLTIEDRANAMQELIDDCRANNASMESIQSNMQQLLDSWDKK